MAIKETERAVKELGLMGLKFQPALQAFYPNDRHFYPLWEKCAELKIPVQFHTGTTGIGAGLPGGMGIKIECCKPLLLDAVAAEMRRGFLGSNNHPGPKTGDRTQFSDPGIPSECTMCKEEY